MTFRQIFASLAALTMFMSFASCELQISDKYKNEDCVFSSKNESSGSSEDRDTGRSSENTDENSLPENYSPEWKGRIASRAELYYLGDELVDGPYTQYLEYDDRGNISRVTTPDFGSYVEQEYDENNNLIYVEEGTLSGVTAAGDPVPEKAMKTSKFEYEYFDDGSVSRITEYVSSGIADDNIDEYFLYVIINLDPSGMPFDIRYYGRYSTGCSSAETFSYSDSTPNVAYVTHYADDTFSEPEMTECELLIPKADGKVDPKDLYGIWDNAVLPDSDVNNSYGYYMYSDPSEVSVSYDSYGNITKFSTKYANESFEYEYSSSGMLLKKAYSTNGSPYYTCEYDGSGNITRYEMFFDASSWHNLDCDSIVFEYTYY
ncbi:MAG: hypothetical protein IJM44_02635 [Ruminococcus sp.]|nr:hypothetical protein [Ruminococcus sp.]